MAAPSGKAAPSGSPTMLPSPSAHALSTASISGDPMVQMMEKLYEQDLIDALRPHLKNEKVFMDADDWHVTPVRMDMLKALARRWKLTNRPDFWKENNTRIKLARALMEHIIQRKEDEKRLAIHTTAPTSVRTKAEEVSTATSEGDINVRAIRALKKALPRYTGDLFGTRNDGYSEGLLYLSRFEKHGDTVDRFAGLHETAPPDAKAARKRYFGKQGGKDTTEIAPGVNVPTAFTTNRRLSTFLQEFHGLGGAGEAPPAESTSPTTAAQQPVAAPALASATKLPISPKLPNERRASNLAPSPLLDAAALRYKSPMRKAGPGETLQSVSTVNSLFASSSHLHAHAVAAAAHDGRDFATMDSTTQLLYDAAAAVAREDLKNQRKRHKEARLRRRMGAILSKIAEHQNLVTSMNEHAVTARTDIIPLPRNISIRARRGSIQLVPDAYSTSTGGVSADVLSAMMAINDAVTHGPDAFHAASKAHASLASPDEIDDTGSLASTPREGEGEGGESTAVSSTAATGKGSSTTKGASPRVKQAGQQGGVGRRSVVMSLEVSSDPAAHRRKLQRDSVEEAEEESDLDDDEENQLAIEALVEQGMLPAGVSVIRSANPNGGATVAISLDSARTGGGKLDPVEAAQMPLDEDDTGIAGVDDDDDPTTHVIAREWQAAYNRRNSGTETGPKKRVLPPLTTEGLHDKLTDGSLQRSLRQQCAQALRELSKKAANRGHIIAEGAHPALVQVLLDSDSFNTKMDCAIALANLSALQPTLNEKAVATALGLAHHDVTVATPKESSEPEFTPLSPAVVQALADLARRLAVASEYGTGSGNETTAPEPSPGLGTGAAAGATTDGAGAPSAGAPGWSDSVNRASMRCLIAITLYNISCDKRNTPVLAGERGVDALLALIPLQCRAYNAQAASSSSPASSPAASPLPSPLSSSAVAATPLTALVDLDLLISADAYTLVLVVRALANIAAAPGGLGVQAIVDCGGISQLSSHWNWMSPALRIVTAAQIVEPCTRPHGCLLRVSGEGGVLLLRSAMRSLYREHMQREAATLVSEAIRGSATSVTEGVTGALDDDEDELEDVGNELSASSLVCSPRFKSWAVRRILIALARVTSSRQGIVRVMRGLGCAAIGEGVEMLLHDLYGPSSPSSASSTGGTARGAPSGTTTHGAAGNVDDEEDAVQRQRMQDMVDETRGNTDMDSTRSAKHAAASPNHHFPMDGHSAGGPGQTKEGAAMVDVPGFRVNIGGSAVLRRVCASLFRLLTHSRGHVAAQQGAVGTVGAILITAGTHDARIAKIALHTIAYAFTIPAIAEYASMDGAAVAALHYLHFALRLANSELENEDFTSKDAAAAANARGLSAANVLPLALLTFYNATCHARVVSRLFLAPAVPPTAASFNLSASLHAVKPLQYATAYFSYMNNNDAAPHCANAALVSFVSRRLRVFENRVLNPTLGGPSFSAIHDLLTAGRLAYVAADGSAPAAEFTQPTVQQLMGLGGLNSSGVPCVKYLLAMLHTFVQRLKVLQASGGGFDVHAPDGVSSWALERRPARVAVGLLPDGGACPGLFSITYRAVCFSLAALRNLSAVDEQFAVAHTEGGAVGVSVHAFRSAAVHSGAIHLIVPLLAPRSVDSRTLANSIGSLSGGPSDAQPSTTTGNSQFFGETPNLPKRDRRLSLSSTYPVPPCLPTSAIADAISVVTNVSQHNASRRALVASGALPLLVPIASGASVSALTAARAFSLYHIRARHYELLRIAARVAAAEREIQPSYQSESAATGGLPGSKRASVSVPGGPLTINISDPKPSLDTGTPSGLVSPFSRSKRRISTSAPAPAPPPTAVTFGEGVTGLPTAAPGLQADHTRIEAAISRARAVCALGLCNLAADASNLIAPVGGGIGVTARTDTARSGVDTTTGSLYSSEEGTLDPMVVRREGILQALIALSNFASDDDPIRLRVAHALHVFSANESIAQMMLEPDVVETPGSKKGVPGESRVTYTSINTLVSLSSSNVEGVRRECAGALYNLSNIGGAEGILIKAGAVRALLVIAMIRSQHADTQAVCVEAVHNLLAVHEYRLQALTSTDSGSVVWALAKLSLSPHVAVQRACAITMFRLAAGSDTQDVLVREGGLKSVITVLRRQHGGQTTALNTSFMSTTSSSAKGQGEDGDGEGEGGSVEQEEEDMRRLQDSLIQRSTTDLQRKADSIVGALFAGVLASVSSRSREQGHLTKLVGQGAVEALVLLSGLDHDASTLTKTRSAPAVAAAGYATDTQGIARLRPSCALGLFNMACSPFSRVRTRVAAGNAADVFITVGCDVENETAHTRRLCALGLASLLWGCDSGGKRQLVAQGAVKVLISLSTRGSPSQSQAALPTITEHDVTHGSATVVSSAPLRDAYAGVVVIVFLSQNKDLHAKMIADGVVPALLSLLARINDSVTSEPDAVDIEVQEEGEPPLPAKDCFIGARVAFLAAAALCNLVCATKASRRAVCEGGFEQLIEATSQATARLSALPIEDIGVTPMGQPLFAYPYGRLGMGQALMATADLEPGSLLRSPSLRQLGEAGSKDSQVFTAAVMREVDVLVALVDNVMTTLAVLSSHRSCHNVLVHKGVFHALSAVFTCGAPGASSPPLSSDPPPTAPALQSSPSKTGGHERSRNRRNSLPTIAHGKLSARVPALTRIRAGVVLRNLSVSPVARDALLQPDCKALMMHLVSLLASADRADVLPTATEVEKDAVSMLQEQLAKSSMSPVAAGFVAQDLRLISSDVDSGRVLLDDSLLCMVPVYNPGHVLTPMPLRAPTRTSVYAATGIRRTSSLSLRTGTQALLEARYGQVAAAAAEALTQTTPVSGSGSEVPPIIGYDDREAELVAKVGFSLLEDAAKAICNIALDFERHASLVACGGALALISVSESPFCPPEVRTACLRSLCELAIEDRDRDESGAGTGGKEETHNAPSLASRRRSGTGAIPSSRPASSSSRRPSLDDATEESNNMVSTGAVSALIAMMGNTAESANEMHKDAAAATVFGPVAAKDDVLVANGPRIGVAIPERAGRTAAELQASLIYQQRPIILTHGDVSSDTYIAARCASLKNIAAAARSGEDAPVDTSGDLAAAPPSSLFHLLLPAGAANNTSTAVRPMTDMDADGVDENQGEGEEMWPKIEHIPLEEDGSDLEIEERRPSVADAGQDTAAQLSMYSKFIALAGGAVTGVLSGPLLPIPPSLNPSVGHTYDQPTATKSAVAPTQAEGVAGGSSSSSGNSYADDTSAQVGMVWDYGHLIVLDDESDPTAKNENDAEGRAAESVGAVPLKRAASVATTSNLARRDSSANIKSPKTLIVPENVDYDFELAFPYVVQPDSYMHDSALGPYPRLEMRGTVMPDKEALAALKDGFSAESYPAVVDPATVSSQSKRKGGKPLLLITASLTHRGDYIDTSSERAAIRRMLWALTSPTSLHLPSNMHSHTGMDSSGVHLTDIDTVPLPAFPDFIMLASGGHAVGLGHAVGNAVGFGRENSDHSSSAISTRANLAVVPAGLRMSKCELTESDEVTASEFEFQVPSFDSEKEKASELLAAHLPRPSSAGTSLVLHVEKATHSSPIQSPTTTRKGDDTSAMVLEAMLARSGFAYADAAAMTEGARRVAYGGNGNQADPALMPKGFSTRAKWQRRIQMQGRQFGGVGVSSTAAAGSSGLNPLMTAGAAPSLAITLGLHMASGGRDTVVLAREAASKGPETRTARASTRRNSVTEAPKVSPATPTRPTVRPVPALAMGQAAARGGHRVVRPSPADAGKAAMPLSARLQIERAQAEEVAQRDHVASMQKHVLERQAASKEHQEKVYGTAPASARTSRRAQTLPVRIAHDIGSLEELIPPAPSATSRKMSAFDEAVHEAFINNTSLVAKR